MKKMVSVVVTTKNEENNIGSCLQSIADQTYSCIEIIVVDNNSEDRTLEIAKRFTSNVHNMGPERSAQRNFGLLVVAKGDYLVYIDADMVLTSNLIECCVREIELSNSAALYIPEAILGSSFFARVRRFERQFYSGTSIDAARFFQKDALVTAGGFDQELFKSGSGEDWDLDKKIRQLGQVKVLPETSALNLNKSWITIFAKYHSMNLPDMWNGILHNEANVTISSYLKKKRYYASGFNGYISKWGSSDPDIKNQFGFRYRAFGVFFEKGKWLHVLKRPHMYFAVIILKLMVLVFTRSEWKLSDKRTS